MINLDDFRNDTLTVSLLLTTACNFHCGHCLYDCGPTRATYMNDDVLRQVYRQVNELRDYEIPVEVNLVGGEPTLNMKRFAEILDEVMGWGVQVTMTTNGWWMHDDRHTEAFLRAVARHVSSDGTGCDGGFSVRISNDRFHLPHRPDWLQRPEAMQRRLASIWDDLILFETPRWWCSRCGQHYGIGTRCSPDECPRGHGYMDYEPEEGNFFVPAPHPNDPWIYVDTWDAYRGVRPTGRGSNWSDYGNEKCNGSYSLGYLPNGKLRDICCGGSRCEFGTADDDPLVLLEIRRRFIKDVQPNCWDCAEMAAEWKKKHLRKVRKAAIAAVDCLDTGDNNDDSDKEEATEDAEQCPVERHHGWPAIAPEVS